MSIGASFTAFKAGAEPPPEDSVPLSSSSLTSLPEEIILNCLVRVPRRYYQNLCRVSKTLKSLVLSPELHGLLTKPKDSVYVSLPYASRWFTFREIESRLVSNPIPFLTNHLAYQSSTVTVGPEVFFICTSAQPSKEVWILDTRSGELTKGPNMKVARLCSETVLEKINGKVYVIGGSDDGKIHVEVFDPKWREWKVAESFKQKLEWRLRKRLSASGTGKVYMVKGRQKILVYDPRKGRGFETVESPGDDILSRMFVVDDVLYGYYLHQGLMGFDAKCKVWRRVVGFEALDVNFYTSATVEYDGMLAIFWSRSVREDEVWCAFIALDWIGDVIRWKVEWYGTVATMRDHCTFHKVLAC